MINSNQLRGNNEIRGPKQLTEKIRYKQKELVGLLNAVKKQKAKINELMKEYKAELSKIEGQVEMLNRRKSTVISAAESIKKERTLAQLDEKLKMMRQYKRELRRAIQEAKDELTDIKKKTKGIKQRIREKRIIKGLIGVATVLVGAEKATQIVKKYKLRIAAIAFAVISAITLLPKSENVKYLPEGREPQEITMQDDRECESAREGFIDSIRIEGDCQNNDVGKYGNEISDGQTSVAEASDSTNINKSTKSEDEMLKIFLENMEGKCRLEVYDLGDGVLSMGWGHTESHGGKYKVGDKITYEQAIEFYKQDRAEAYRIVDNTISQYPELDLKPHQRNALASFTYNTGRK